MTDFYLQVSRECSALITRRYSTSFSSAIGLLDKTMRLPICSIYGFVRLADEIVDSFHDQDKAARLAEFTADTWRSIEERFSLNPVLHAYQDVVNRYNIPADLTQAFLHSMAMDLQKTTYANAGELDEYIYGSAEVVGLMCLCIFVAGDKAQYEHLKEPARRLGAAFQKINFLRDLQADYEGLHRSYFPGFDFEHFDGPAKSAIEDDVAADFAAGALGITQLPDGARLGVYIAYRYYLSLFKRIQATPAAQVLQRRIRVPDGKKLLIVMGAKLRWQLGKV